MSLLAQQLSNLKKQNALKIAPGAPVPTFMLDKNTARNTTIDVIYTMAVMGFAEIKKQLVGSGKSLGEELLSENYKQINRNKLNKQQNNIVSTKTTKFLLLLSPFFLNRSCQTVIEYLIRNFKVHVFQPEQLVLIFLQYWQHPIYNDLLVNIQSKNPSLSFLKELQSKKQINFAFILKSVTYSRNLLENLIMLTKQYIKEESAFNDEQIQIDLMYHKTMIDKKVSFQVSNLIKYDIKQFLLKILASMITQIKSNFIKDICQFCLFAAKQESAEARSMSIILAISLLSNAQVSQQWVNRLLKYLISFGLNQNLFNFIMLICQRWPQCITHDVLNKTIGQNGFLCFLSKFSGTRCMLFYICIKFYLDFSFNSHKNIMAQLLQMIVLEIKEQQFMVNYQNNLYASIFELMINKKQQLQQKGKNIDSDHKKLWDFLTMMVKKHLLYEYALYLYNQQIQKDVLFEKAVKINANGKIDLKSIKKARCDSKPEYKSVKKYQKQNDFSIIQQQSAQQQEKQTVKSKSILQIVNQRFQKKYKKLDYNNSCSAQQLGHLSELIKQYYQNIKNLNSDNEEIDSIWQINREQKNRLLQFAPLFQCYDKICFEADLKNRDYSTPIKYIMKTVDSELCYSVFYQLINQATPQNIDKHLKDVMSDILYRQLCRQAIDKLADLAETHYVKIVGSMAKLYHQLSKLITPQTAVIINTLIMKISKGIFLKIGHNHGKIYKQLYLHSKILTYVSHSNVVKDEQVQKHYQDLITIFGWENLYGILIGSVEQVVKKQKKNKGHLKFIENIILSSFESDQTYQNIHQILIATQKMAIFAYYLLSQEKQQQGDSVLDVIKQFGSGVAKKMIINFFGLQKEQKRRQIARQILIFISYVFKSQKFQSLFKVILTSTQKKLEKKISQRCTSIYKIFTYLQNITKGPLKQITVQIKSAVIILFPLQLRIQVLGPLLPSQELYRNLSGQLKLHGHQKFASLKAYVNIVPPKLSENYLNFTIQCMKRQYIPSFEVCSQILNKQSTGKPQIQQLKIEFICSFTLYAREESLDLLPAMFENVFRVCHEPNQYSLAVAHQLIGNLKDFIDPYLDQLFAMAIQVDSEHIKNFIQRVANSFTQPVLLTLAKRHYKTVKNFINFTNYLRKIAENVNYESLLKIFNVFCVHSTAVYLQQEKYFSKLHFDLAEVFIEMALKMNDNQLRKAILDLIRLGSQKNKEDSNAGLIFNAKKNLVTVIYTGLSRKLGELFTHFYGYIFEQIVKDISGLKRIQNQKSITQNQKRDRPLSQFALQCSILYTKSMLQCLKQLFKHDQQNQFMDSIKFDSLAPEIASIFSVTKFGEQYSNIMNDYLQPCLISLYQHTKDDYKLKTLNTQIIRVIRLKQVRINIAVFGFFDEVINHIDHRFLIFTDELTPVMIEFSDSRNTQIKKHIQSIIHKLQTISGTTIERFAK